MTEWISLLDQMPPELVVVWVLNEEYEDVYDPFHQRYSLKIREADYHRGFGWHILEKGIKPRVKYWTHITSKEELPKTWEITS